MLEGTKNRNENLTQSTAANSIRNFTKFENAATQRGLKQTNNDSFNKDHICCLRAHVLFLAVMSTLLIVCSSLVSKFLPAQKTCTHPIDSAKFECRRPYSPLLLSSISQSSHHHRRCRNELFEFFRFTLTTLLILTKKANFLLNVSSTCFMSNDADFIRYRFSYMSKILFRQ